MGLLFGVVVVAEKGNEIEKQNRRIQREERERRRKEREGTVHSHHAGRRDATGPAAVKWMNSKKRRPC